MSRFCDTLKLFKLANLRILLNDLWTVAYDGVEARTGLAPAFLPPLGRGGSPEQSTTGVDRLSWMVIERHSPVAASSP